MTDTIAAQGNMLYKIALRHKMGEAKSLSVLLEAKCQEILSDSVRVIDKEGKEVILPADTVIIATGVKAKGKQQKAFMELYL